MILSGIRGESSESPDGEGYGGAGVSRNLDGSEKDTYGCFSSSGTHSTIGCHVYVSWVVPVSVRGNEELGISRGPTNTMADSRPYISFLGRYECKILNYT